MKITIEEPKPNTEEEIIIRCKNLTPEVMKLISSLKEDKSKITGYEGENITPLFLKDIYYFESVDNKVFAYTKEKVYEVKLKLYEIEETYDCTDMLRISKSTIINLSKIAHLTPRLNGKFESVMKNGETIIISRQYVTILKEKLGI